MATQGNPGIAAMNAGNAFEANAAGMARLMLIKIALQQPALNGPLLDRQLSFVRHLAVAAPPSGDGGKKAPAWWYADFSMRSGSGDTRPVHVVGEIKWSGATVDPVESAKAQLDMAFESQRKAARTHRSPVAMIVLGWSPGSEAALQAIVDRAVELVATAAGPDNPAQSVSLSLRPADDGTPGGAIVEVSVAYPVPDQLLASRWIFVITPATRTPDALGAWIAGEVNDAVDELARVLFGPWIEHAADLVVDRAASAGTEFPLIPLELKGMPAPAGDVAATRTLLGFMLDPWGKLTRDYVQMARLGERQRGRWSALIGETIQGDTRALALTRRMMGSFIAPMPVNLGIVKGSLVVPLFRYFDSSRDAAPPGSVKGPPVSILEGGSGSGKTTLIEHVYSLWTEALAIGEDLVEVRELPVFVPVERLKEEELSGDEPVDVVRVLCEAALRGTLEHYTARHNLLATTWTATDSGAMRALLRRIPICLLVDGYDQLRPGLREAFRTFTRRLKTSGVRIRRIVLTSRPDSGAVGAMEWLNVLTLADRAADPALHTRPLVCEYVVGAPDEKASEAFVGSWLKSISMLAARDADRYTVEAFKAWLRTGVAAAATPAADTVDLWREVSRSPLHTTLALIAYASEDAPRTIATTADLFEALFFRLKPLPSHDATARSAPILTANERSRACLESIAFGMLMRADRNIGEFTPGDVLSHVAAAADGAAVTVQGALLELMAGQPLDDAAPQRWLHDLPFLVPQTAEGRASFAFLHVSIEEYLASGHLRRFMARQLAGGALKVPDAQGRPVDPGQTTVDADGVRGTALGDIVVRLGREAFKYLVAQLRQAADSRDGARLAYHFLAACARDVGLQQYLYDTGYVDVSFDELRRTSLALALRRPEAGDVDAATLASVALRKFMGHHQYGISDDPGANAALEELAQEVATMAVAEPAWAGLACWYQLFVQDHLFNRGASQANRQAFEDKLPPALALQAAAANAPQPQDLLYVLRAGHYYGHLGNHSVSHCDRLAADWVSTKQAIAWSAVDTQVDQGLAYYVAAIELRRVALWLTMPDWFEQRADLAPATDGGLLFERWRAAMAATRGDPSVPCERFVGPSQAVGDIANQHCAAATLHLWRWLAAAARGRADAATEALARARAEAERMRQMWRLSGEPRLRAIRGEGAIKYELYTPGLEEKLAVAESVAQGQAGSKAVVLQQSDRRVRVRLANLERDLGLRYGIANQRVPASLRTFVQALGEAQLLQG